MSLQPKLLELAKQETFGEPRGGQGQGLSPAVAVQSRDVPREGGDEDADKDNNTGEDEDEKMSGDGDQGEGNDEGMDGDADSDAHNPSGGDRLSDEDYEP